MTHWRSPCCWERLRVGAEEGSEDEMAGQHHRCNKHELGHAPGDAEGQGGLACCSPCDHRVGHEWVTEQQQITSRKYERSKVNKLENRKTVRKLVK